MRNTFYGTVSGGSKIIWNNPVAVSSQLMFLEGKKVKVTITDELKDISDPQRKYYFGHLVSVLADEFGWSKDEMHEWCKAKFASKVEMVKIKDRVIETRRIPSLMDLSTVEAEKYYLDIRQWGNENGVILLEPNQWEELTK